MSFQAGKALTERLETGKVTQPDKVKQYLSLISSDIERLIRLVSNILNFSVIEEGKKVYKFEQTDMGTWLEQVVFNLLDNAAKFSPGTGKEAQVTDQRVPRKQCLDRPAQG